MVKVPHSCTARTSAGGAGLGSWARMNLPGRPGGNWQWRYKPGALNPDLQQRLLVLTATFGRLPQQTPADEEAAAQPAAA